MADWASGQLRRWGREVAGFQKHFEVVLTRFADELDATQGPQGEKETGVHTDSRMGRLAFNRDGKTAGEGLLQRLVGGGLNLKSLLDPREMSGGQVT